MGMTFLEELMSQTQQTGAGQDVLSPAVSPASSSTQ